MGERNYLAEAQRILDGRTGILPERQHLEALERAHIEELIRISNLLSHVRISMVKRANP